MSHPPKISIVVAVYNRANTLAKCIESVKNQTYPQKELIIIDGGSNDGTVDILKSYNNDITYWESKKDKGIYDALNKGIAKTNGEWIIILGADDYLWADDVLEKASKKLSSKIENPLKQINSQLLPLIYGKVAVVDDNYKIVEMQGIPWNNSNQKIFFEEKNIIPHQGVLHHKKLFEIYGNFSENYYCAGDYEFLLRILLQNNNQALFFDDIIVAGMRNDGLSNQNKHAVKIFFEEIRARKADLHYCPSKYKFICKFMKIWIKQSIARLFGERYINYIKNVLKKI